MGNVKKINKSEIESLEKSNSVIKEEYAPHFLIKQYSNREYIALHHTREWAYNSKNRTTINEAIRDYMILTVKCKDPRNDVTFGKAKKIIRERKKLVKELCQVLSIPVNTNLDYEELRAIDKKIFEKGSKEIYKKYYINLAVFLGEILVKKTNGSWFLKKCKDSALFIEFEVPYIKTSIGTEWDPWDCIGRFYKDESGIFSLTSSVVTVLEGFGVYYHDFKSN